MQASCMIKNKNKGGRGGGFLQSNVTCNELCDCLAVLSLIKQKSKSSVSSSLKVRDFSLLTFTDPLLTSYSDNGHD